MGLYKTILTELEEIGEVDREKDSDLYGILASNAEEAFFEIVNYKIVRLNEELSDEEAKEIFEEMLEAIEEVREYLKRGKEFIERRGKDE